VLYEYPTKGYLFQEWLALRGLPSIIGPSPSPSLPPKTWNLMHKVVSLFCGVRCYFFHSKNLSGCKILSFHEVKFYLARSFSYRHQPKHSMWMEDNPTPLSPSYFLSIQGMVHARCMQCFWVSQPQRSVCVHLQRLKAKLIKFSSLEATLVVDGAKLHNQMMINLSCLAKGNLL
jgi:hypothetical protein